MTTIFARARTIPGGATAWQVHVVTDGELTTVEASSADGADALVEAVRDLVASPPPEHP
jgi:hypothetical protein